MPSIHRLALLAAGLLAGQPAHAAAIFIVNADFEAGPRPAESDAQPGSEFDMPGWSGGPSTQVWNPVDAQLRNSATYGVVAGVKGVGVSTNGLATRRAATAMMWSQVVQDAVLAANTRYTLTVDIATDTSNPNWGYDFALISGDLDANDGPILAHRAGRTDDSGATLSSGRFGTVSLVFETGADGVGIGNQFAIGLSGRAASGQRIAYDNVRLDATSLLGVPEPQTWAMLIAGFGTVGGAMRRRGRLAGLTV